MKYLGHSRYETDDDCHCYSNIIFNKLWDAIFTLHKVEEFLLLPQSVKAHELSKNICIYIYYFYI